MIKYVLTIIIFFTVMISAVPYTAESTEKADYLYTITDNKVSITGFSGEPVFLEIPDIIDGCRVVEIYDNAFYECSTLRNIKLPDSIEKIGHHAFYGCSSLESIVVPDSVNEIGMGCFCGDSALTSVALPENITKIPESCFRSCISLKTVIIPENVTAMGDFCFSGCTSLSSVSLNNTLQKIGDCSFYMCESLTGIYIPSSVNEIGFCAVGYVPTPDGASTLEKFVLLGAKKSSAERYAKENSLTFETASDSVHAIAIQKINGQRVYIPSITLFGGIIMMSVMIILVGHKKIHMKK